MTFRSIDPATEVEIGQYPGHTKTEVEDRLERAVEAQRQWAARNIADRSLVVRAIGERLLVRIDECAAMITSEMGKPLTQSIAEVRKCASVLDYMSTAALHELRDVNIAAEYASSFVRYEPLGLVLSIMPWNFPLWQFFRFAAPSLMAGNGIMLKHAPTTWGCAELAVDICREGGLPDALVNTLRIDVADVESVVADQRINAVTFTGSTRGGSAVGALAGKYVKKSVLELGGSDAYIVREDADVDHAARVCVLQRCSNAGQSCISAKRFIVHRRIAQEFRDRVVARMGELVIGDPTDPSVGMGPLARADLKETLLRQVSQAINEGATLLVDGRPQSAEALDIGGVGYFVKPGLLVDVQPNSTANNEELFGPVAAMITVDSDEEAVTIANGSMYGLGAAVFTNDNVKADQLARQLQCGNVFINDFVRSDPRLPFGGVKMSGYGRELGRPGLLEFVNIKTVVQP